MTLPVEYDPLALVEVTLVTVGEERTECVTPADVLTLKLSSPA